MQMFVPVGGQRDFSGALAVFVRGFIMNRMSIFALLLSSLVLSSLSAVSNAADSSSLAPSVPAATGQWFTDDNTGCQLWHAAPPRGVTLQWRGACANGYAEGQGTAEWRAGTRLWRYVGEVKAGKYQGKGFWQDQNGDRYEGQYVEGAREGSGALQFANGDRYSGEFHADQRSGSGELFRKNGEHYQGQFLNGQRHGAGKMEWGNGTYFLGEFASDKPLSGGHAVVLVDPAYRDPYWYRDSRPIFQSAVWCLENCENANQRWVFAVARLNILADGTYLYMQDVPCPETRYGECRDNLVKFIADAKAQPRQAVR